MRYIEASPQLRLRPAHMLVLLYRYLCGTYQIGDLSAMNYLKGFLDARDAELNRVLSISGHGIGEAEMWLWERSAAPRIDVMSFRLLDTQLLQFLRAADPPHVETAFAAFAEIVQPWHILSRLVADPGLVPYWCEQVQLLKRCFDSGRVSVYSDDPRRIPGDQQYDLIYVSHPGNELDPAVVQSLRQHLRPAGWLATLRPLQSDRVDSGGTAWFSESEPVLAAKGQLRKHLRDCGFRLNPETTSPPDLNGAVSRREIIRFTVRAPAGAVLLGELILHSLPEHLSDRARLEALNTTAAQFDQLRAPVNLGFDLLLTEALS